MKRSAEGGRKAVFLDRDGTITKPNGYVTHPNQLRLLDGAAAALRRLAAHKFLCILVTNQSAIGRGMITVSELARIHAELFRQLEAEDAILDAVYFCPSAPQSCDERAIEFNNRKPGPGMLLQAAADHRVDLSQSWMVGDRLSDVLAGINAGCRSIRVDSGFHYEIDETPLGVPVVPSLQEAAELIIREH